MSVNNEISQVVYRDLGTEELSFIAAYQRQDQTYNTFVVVRVVSGQDLLKLIATVFPECTVSNGGNLISINSSTLNACIELLDVDLPAVFSEDNTGAYRLRVRAFGLPHLSRQLETVIRGLPELKRVPTPGVYTVEIHHLYIDERGNVKEVRHRRRTDGFDDIYPELYPRINAPLLMEMYAESKENNLILTGAPGTGKTCFVKRCLADLAKNYKRDIDVVYVKDQALLKQDSFWARMGEWQPDVIVLDDLDDELKPRTAGRNDIVNHMLSFSDGLFDLETKIIITSNQPNTAIDGALIRPGRCFDILSLPQLTQDEAFEVWTTKLERSPDSFQQVFHDTSGNISQAFLMSEYQRFLKHGVSPYLHDQSLSIRREVQAGALINAEEDEVEPTESVEPGKVQ